MASTPSRLVSRPQLIQGLSNELTFEECLRDIGLEDEALRLAIRRPSCLSMRFAHSVTGWEYGRVQAWGENPAVAVCKK